MSIAPMNPMPKVVLTIPGESATTIISLSIVSKDSVLIMLFKAAALNSMIKTLSFETIESEIIVVALSPGIVNTTLGMGFMGAIDIDESVSKMMVVIDNLTMDHNGLFLDYEDGRVIGW